MRQGTRERRKSNAAPPTAEELEAAQVDFDVKAAQAAKDEEAARNEELALAAPVASKAIVAVGAVEDAAKAAAEAKGKAVEKAAAAVEAGEALKNEDYLRRVGLRTWGVAALLHGVLFSALILTRTLEATPGGTSWTEAFLASTTLFLILLVISVVRKPRGLMSALIGQDGRFSTSYLQAWIWTITLVWAFFFFVWVNAVGGSDQLTTATSNLGVEYLLLLGGPFAALIAAKQIYASKTADGDVQKVTALNTTLKDALSDDRGRTDLVDLQYLMFNFVALAYFFVTFARHTEALPNLPEGLVALTSGAALAYVGKKAVDRNAPAITSVALAYGTGTPTVGDTVRIRGYNFVPLGAEAEEYLSRVSVRFDAVKTPVAPAGGTGAVPGAVQPVTVANVSPTEILVTLPPLELAGEKSVSVVVITAAGVETDAYQLVVAPRTLVAQFPIRITAGESFTISLPGLTVGTPVTVVLGDVVQNLEVAADRTVEVIAPSNLTGTPQLSLKSGGAGLSRVLELTE